MGGLKQQLTKKLME